MKRLEINIKCCRECPYLENDTIDYWCSHEDFDEDSPKRGMDDHVFDVDLTIHPGCPLKDTVKSNERTTTIPIVRTHQFIDRYKHEDHDCRDHKKYSTGGCTACWSCKICGQFGGCDNQA